MKDIEEMDVFELNARRDIEESLGAMFDVDQRKLAVNRIRRLARFVELNAPTFLIDKEIDLISASMSDLYPDTPEETIKLTVIKGGKG